MKTYITLRNTHSNLSMERKKLNMKVRKSSAWQLLPRRHQKGDKILGEKVEDKLQQSD